MFLNKQDLLERKIQQGKKLEDYFPDYKNYKPKEKKSYSISEYEKAKRYMNYKILVSIPELKMACLCRFI